MTPVSAAEERVEVGKDKGNCMDKAECATEALLLLRVGAKKTFPLCTIEMITC